MRKLMGMTALMLVVLASIGVLTRQAQAEHSQAVKATQVAAKACPGHVEGVRYYRAIVWRLQTMQQKDRQLSNFNPHRTGCAYTKWVANVWRERVKTQRVQYNRWRTLDTGDWLTATTLVQRPFPGTKTWLVNCSGGTHDGNGEGGHAGFVMNHQGSGAGGWMQFMRSTYYSYASMAFATARARGFVISEAHNRWEDPLGQALVAGFIRNRSISEARYHWDPSIDSACA